MEPLIGISCSYDLAEGRYFLPEAYVDAVIDSGGVPLILPGAGSIKSVTPYIRAVKGLVLAGGGDIDPKYFNEEPHPSLGEVTPDRDRFEIMLVKTALSRNIPVLGICRGIQIINVACGGTLIQHIPAEVKKPVKHFQTAPRWYPTHRILIDKSSLLGQILKARSARVNSFHHQAVCDLAPGFFITAVTNDDVVEAIETREYKFVIGVQWHPEGMVSKDEKSRLLFGAFVEACRKA